MFLKLLDNADSRIDFRLLIVELKSLKRYKNEFSLDLFAFCDFKLRNGKDFLVGAIVKYNDSILLLWNCTRICTK